MRTIIKVLAVGFVALVTISGCKTIEVIKTQDHYIHDTTTIYNTRVDSLRLVDSIVIKQKADTIFVEKYKFRDRWRSVHDSIYLSKTDTIKVVDKQVIKEGQSKVSTFLKGSGIALWVLVVVFLIGWFLKKFFKR